MHAYESLGNQFNIGHLCTRAQCDAGRGDEVTVPPNDISVATS